MSQHTFSTTNKANQPIRVLMGWDRRLSHHFMSVERVIPDDQEMTPELAADLDENGTVYSSLGEPNAFEMTLDDLKERLTALDIQVPQSMFEQLEEDRICSAGNRIVQYEADGSFSEHGQPQRQRGA